MQTYVTRWAPSCSDCNPMLLDFDTGSVQSPNSRVVPTQCLQCLQLVVVPSTVCFNEATFTYTFARILNGCLNRDEAVSNTILGSVCCSSDKYRFTYCLLFSFISLLLFLNMSLISLIFFKRLPEGERNEFREE